MTPIARQSSPRVLLPPPPRQTIRRRGLHPALKAVLFCLIPHVWVGVGLAAVVLGSIAVTIAGQARTAHVVDRQVTHGKKTQYHIIYAYEESGRRYQDSATMSSTEYDRFPLGTPLQIKSLHVGRFGSSRLTAGIDRSGVFCMAFFAILWNGFLFFLFFNLVLAPLRQRARVRDGDAVPGRIVSRKETKGKGATYTLTYFYTTLDGRQSTDSMTVREADYRLLRNGDDVTILYTPAGSRDRSIVYECSDYLATDACGYPIHPCNDRM